jgi:hypothetical protein
VVYNGKNGIMSVAFRESRDQVHCYVRKWLGVNGRGDAVEWGFDVVHQVFILLACGASFDIFCDPCPGAGPEVLLVHMSDCFISPGVAIEGTVVPGMHDFTL